MVLESLRLGCKRGAAIKAAGIAKATFYAWMKENHGELDDRMGEAQAQAIIAVESTLFARALSAIDRSANTAAIFWLKNNAGWVDVYDQRHSGEIKTSLTDKARALRAALPPETLAQVHALIAEVESVES